MDHQGRDEPTPRGERPRVPRARQAGGVPSAQREMNDVHRPIRQGLFGGILGRQTECGGDGLASRSPGGKRSAQFRRATGIDIRRSKKSTAPVVSGNGALDAYIKRSI